VAFEKIDRKEFTAKLPTVPPKLFDDNQSRYLEAFLKDLERSLERVYAEARRPATADGNPHREAVNLNGKSGNIRVDLKYSQLSLGAPVLIWADSLGGDVVIQGLDNAYVWTMVIVVNLDGANSVTVENNAEQELDSGTDKVLTQYDTISLVQVTNEPRWAQLSTLQAN